MERLDEISYCLLSQFGVPLHQRLNTAMLGITSESFGIIPKSITSSVLATQERVQRIFSAL
jgi:hypothetical protein